MLILKSSENRVKAIRQFVQTHCIFEFTDVTPRELDLLCEVIACGEVGDKAKKNFIMNYNTSKENYGQIVKRLADKKILINKNGRNGKLLHDSFTMLVEDYIEKEKTNKPNVMLLEWKV